MQLATACFRNRSPTMEDALVVNKERVARGEVYVDALLLRRRRQDVTELVQRCLVLHDLICGLEPRRTEEQVAVSTGA